MSIKTEKIWFDGKLVNWEDAKVHVLSHGLHYGTGYFEGIRCYALVDGRSAVFRLRDHMRRFADSGRILGFPLPYSVAELEQATFDVIRANQLKECYIRPLAFLGLGELDQLLRPEVRLDNDVDVHGAVPSFRPPQRGPAILRKERCRASAEPQARPLDGLATITLALQTAHDCMPGLLSPRRGPRHGDGPRVAQHAPPIYASVSCIMVNRL